MNTDKTKYGSRRGMKLPQIVPRAVGRNMSATEIAEISKSVAEAKGKNFSKKITDFGDKLVDENVFLKYDASELTVITYLKKLSSYVITVTKNSPQRYRFTFVNRMHNYCLDILENVIRANSMKKTDNREKNKRKEYQHEAYTELKLLGYICLLAYENNCILKKQYIQIAKQISDCINLLVAWAKSDIIKKS